MPPCGAAVQVTECTMPDAGSRSSLADQPGCVSACTEVTLDRSTVRAVVAAPLVDSLGTWKVTSAMPPRTASSLLAWTWADASAMAAAAEIRARQTVLRCHDIRLLFLCRRGGIRPRRRAAIDSGQSEPRHQVGVDLIELSGDRGVGGTAACGGHVLCSGDGRRQVGETFGNGGHKLRGLGVLGLLLLHRVQRLLGAGDAGRQPAAVPGKLPDLG